jgi:hypothetical protein
VSDDVTIRAARAQQLLEDEVFNEAFLSLNQDAFDTIVLTDIKDAAACIAAVAKAKAVADFELKFREYITAGKASERKPYKVA